MLTQLENALRQLPWLDNAIVSRPLLALLAFGLIVLLLGLMRLVLSRKSIVSGLQTTFLGLMLAVVSLGLIVIGSSLQGYSRLLPERELLDLRFKTGADGTRSVHVETVRLPGLRPRPKSDVAGDWRIHGEQWQLSARVFALGNRRYYKFQHLISRQQAAEGENPETARAFRITVQAQPDIWQWFNQHLSELPWLRTFILYSEFRPIDVNRSYRVAMGESQIRTIEQSTGEQGSVP